MTAKKKPAAKKKTQAKASTTTKKAAAVKPSADPVVKAKSAKIADQPAATTTIEAKKEVPEGTDKAEKPKIGRPTKFSQTIADEFCMLVMEGEPVRQIAMLEHMPEERTFYRWLATNEPFCQQYARAKEIQAERHAEELLEIADDGRNDWEERENERGGGSHVALNAEAIARSRLRVETRKWLMGKMKPKKYGDKIDMNHGLQPENPLADLFGKIVGGSESRARPGG